jgi:hypothetical protein
MGSLRSLTSRLLHGVTVPAELSDRVLLSSLGALLLSTFVAAPQAGARNLCSGGGTHPRGQARHHHRHL